MVKQLPANTPVAHGRFDIGVPDERDIPDRLHAHDADEPLIFLVEITATQ